MSATANMRARKKPMSVKPSLGSKRKRQMRRGQPSIKTVAVQRPRIKSVLVIDVGGTSVKILATDNQKVGRFDPDRSSLRGKWCQK
jgi:hexokinase